MSTLVYQTADVCQRRQLEYWNELICQRFTQLECQTKPCDGYRGRLSMVDLGVVQLSEVDVDPAGVFHSQSLVARADEDNMLVHLQVAGTSLNTQHGSSLHLQPGEFAFCNTTERYSVEFEQAMKMLVIKFNTEEFTRRTSLQPFEVTCRTGRVAQTGNSLVTQVALSAWQRSMDFCSDAAREALGEVVMATIAAQTVAAFGRSDKVVPQSDRLYTRALAFIASHLEDPTLTQEAVASHLGISARYLRRLFASNNTTFSRYLLERRLRLAHRLLSQSKDSRGRVSRIAYACGFNNCSHFTRVFNDRYGAPPRTVFQGVLVRGGK